MLYDATWIYELPIKALAYFDPRDFEPDGSFGRIMSAVDQVELHQLISAASKVRMRKTVVPQAERGVFLNKREEILFYASLDPTIYEVKRYETKARTKKLLQAYFEQAAIDMFNNEELRTALHETEYSAARAYLQYQGYMI